MSHQPGAAHAPSPFLRGDAPVWYYAALTIAMAVIVILHQAAGPAVAGWCLIGCVVATFTTAHKVFPLAGAGTLVIFGLTLGLTTVHAWEAEIGSNLKVLLLIACMVPAVHFFKDLLEVGFSAILLRVRAKLALAICFLEFGCETSRWFDALTVAALGLAAFAVLHQNYETKEHAVRMSQASTDAERLALHERLENYRALLRQLLMYLLVGTMVGGISTLPGEPQNYQVGEMWKWGFQEYFVRMWPISWPLQLFALLLVVLLESTVLGRVFGYGTKMPDAVRTFLTEHVASETSKRTSADRYRLTVQAVGGILLIVGLALQVASIGLLGLMTMLIVSQLMGHVSESRYVPAYHAAMPFFALLLVFFGAVSIIHEQHLFAGLMNWIAGLPGAQQLVAMFLETGVVSSVSDNVFVACAHAKDVLRLLSEGLITQEQADKLAIAVIAGTNIVSIATPNGQAAFLLAICSPTAAALRLHYARMLWMAVPFTVVLTAVGVYCVAYRI